ncbi:nitrate/nitrite transporter [Mycobacterium sp. pUA109]|uniref:nitrate/nitrite transporter n=1 Tax=Mycobacterium sp. pUA109 TaxID=3238982 RepID=UPI00351ACDF9
MRPWIVWCTGLLAYIVAVLDRTTFGVSGLDAADRFGASSSVLSTFVVLQIIVYAATQIPAGVLLDRFGPKAMIATGLAIISTGQLTLGLTHSLPTAIGAYALVGLGDAFIFISAIRLVPNWFAPPMVPLVTQLTGICGQLGQVLSAVPFLALLLHHGWTVAYAAAAALGVLSIVLTLALVRDTPHGTEVVAEPRTVHSTLADIKAVWSRPGTRLGFFTHMGTQFAMTVFALMWGVPYLTKAQGLTPSVAGGLLTVSVATFAVAGVAIGIFSGRHPHARPALVLGLIIASATIWTVVLALPFRAPGWLLVLLVVVIAVSQTVSLVAFDFARTYNPRTSLGTAQGMVNTGGFIASLLVMQAMGIIIGGVYSFDSFRAAWTVQYVVWAVAAVGVARSGRQARHSERLGEPGALTISPGH